MEFYQCITDFIFLEDRPEKADVIFVPGGNYPDAARHAAFLYHQGYAPYILPSGKYSIVKGKFELPKQDTADRGRTGPESGSPEDFGRFETECDYLCDILAQEGVPQEAVIREDQATFTYENAIYSRIKLETLDRIPERAILCCQAFHARRSLMYYQEQFSDTEFLVCPVVTRGISRDTWFQFDEGIDTVLGEVERCGSQFHQIMRDHQKNGRIPGGKND